MKFKVQRDLWQPNIVQTKPMFCDLYSINHSEATLDAMIQILCRTHCNPLMSLLSNYAKWLFCSLAFLSRIPPLYSQFLPFSQTSLIKRNNHSLTDLLPTEVLTYLNLSLLLVPQIQWLSPFQEQFSSSYILFVSFKNALLLYQRLLY